MNKKKLPGKLEVEKNNEWLLKQTLQENALKLERLSQDQARKIAELNKVQQEIDELNRLYLRRKVKK